MPSQFLQLDNPPALQNATLLLALTGWMDGGWSPPARSNTCMDGRQLDRNRTHRSRPFYIFNFPGPMEIA